MTRIETSGGKTLDNKLLGVRNCVCLAHCMSPASSILPKCSRHLINTGCMSEWLLCVGKIMNNNTSGLITVCIKKR